MAPVAQINLRLEWLGELVRQDHVHGELFIKTYIGGQFAMRCRKHQMMRVRRKLWHPLRFGETIKAPNGEDDARFWFKSDRVKTYAKESKKRIDIIAALVTERVITVNCAMDS